MGHKKWNCPERKRQFKEKKKKTQKKDSDSDTNSDDNGYVSSVVEDMMILTEDDRGKVSQSVSIVEERITIVSNDEVVNHVSSGVMIRIPDSGASIHATSHREFFTNYTCGDFGVVKMGNNDMARIIGMEDVHLKTTNGTKLVLKSVRHIESLRLNVLPVGLLDQEGYLSRFGDGKYKLTKGSMVIAKGNKVSALYHIEQIVCVDALEKDDPCVLWHKRLGHMSEKGMVVLVEKNVLPGVKSVHLKKCTDCLVGINQELLSKVSLPLRQSSWN